MIIFLCITLILLITITYSIIKFDEKYQNTIVHLFIIRCFWIACCLLPFIWYIFIKDLVHFQWSDNANGSAALGLALIALISPILIIAGFLIGHALFLTVFTITHSIYVKIYSNSTKFIPSILLTVLMIILILLLIWWGMFSSEKSIPLRIYTWNLVILTFPWIPVIGALFIQKLKSQKN